MNTAINTDKEIWRKAGGDYSSPSIHITKNGDIGINVAGYVLVAPVEHWHLAGIKCFTVPLQPAKRKWWRLFRY